MHNNGPSSERDWREEFFLRASVKRRNTTCGSSMAERFSWRSTCPGFSKRKHCSSRAEDTGCTARGESPCQPGQKNKTAHTDRQTSSVEAGEVRQRAQLVHESHKLAALEGSAWKNEKEARMVVLPRRDQGRRERGARDLNN